MLSRRALCALTFASCFVNMASAWWGTGHMIVARIAYEKLTKENPSLIDRANGILKGIASFTPLEQNYPFVECATFADEIKGRGWDDQAHWHFVDNVFEDDGFKKLIYPEQYNATWAIGEMMSSLKGARGEEASRQSVSFALGDSFNIRLLIHYVGDIHQPLHDGDRYTDEYPDGDEGGNKFPLTPSGEIKELHALWDSVVEEYTNDLNLPLSSSDWDFLGQQASKITTEYPESSITDLYSDYQTWSAEAFDIVESFVYKNIKENSTPSDDYITQGRQIAEKQLAKGGYRLAHIFETMWGKEQLEETEESTFLL